MKPWFWVSGLVVLISSLAHANPGAVTLQQATPSSVSVIQAPIRLSEWLLQQQSPSYPLGLQWRVPQEQPGQEQLKQQLLGWLQDPKDKHHPTLSPDALQHLIQWIDSLAVTGRVAVGTPDARWLQAHPEQDPLLEPGQSVVLPPPTQGGECADEFWKTMPLTP